MAATRYPRDFSSRTSFSRSVVFPTPELPTTLITGTLTIASLPRSVLRREGRTGSPSLHPLPPEYPGAGRGVCQVGPLLNVGFSPTGQAAGAASQSRSLLSGAAPPPSSSAAPQRNRTLPDRHRHESFVPSFTERVGRACPTSPAERSSSFRLARSPP